MLVLDRRSGHEGQGDLRWTVVAVLLAFACHLPAGVAQAGKYKPISTEPGPVRHDPCENSRYINQVVRRQMVHGALEGDLGYNPAPECDRVRPLSEEFNSVAEYRRFVDDEHGLDRLELQYIFGQPSALMYSMSEEKYRRYREILIERGVSAERMYQMERWRTWEREHDCFDGMMVSVPKGVDISGVESLPDWCEITIEAWQIPVRARQHVKPRTIVWSKSAGGFEQRPPVDQVIDGGRRKPMGPVRIPSRPTEIDPDDVVAEYPGQRWYILGAASVTGLSAIALLFMMLGRKVRKQQ